MLKAMEGCLFCGFGIRWQVFGKFLLKSVNAVYVVHSYTVRTIPDRVHRIGKYLDRTWGFVSQNRLTERPC